MPNLDHGILKLVLEMRRLLIFGEVTRKRNMKSLVSIHVSNLDILWLSH